MTDARPAVLLVGNFLSHRPGRSVAVCERLAARLGAAGHAVTTTSHREERVLRVGAMVLRALRARYDVAVVEVYSGSAFAWAEASSWAVRRRGRPLVLALHGGMLPSWSEKGGQRSRAQRLLARADDVVSPSEVLVEWARGLGFEATRVANGLDLARFGWEPAWRPEPRLRWLRALHAVYDPASALEALARLRADGVAATLELAGADRGEASMLAARARALGVEGSLEMPGWVPPDGVPAWLARGGIFLNTTTAESFGQSVAEAAAVGLPVVTTNVGELPRIWRDGEDVLFVEPGRPDEIAAAVRRLLTEPGLADGLRGAARRRAETFDWSAVLPAWEECFRRALDGRRARPPR